MLKRITIAIVMLFTLAACGGGTTAPAPDAAEQGAEARDTSNQSLVEAQPPATMDYSPTRNAINKWVEHWGQPGQLAFVYVTAQGEPTGYYIFEGLPVSYCAALTPTYDFESADGGQYSQDFLVPAPGVDGAYYSGGQCNQYYGWDAETGAYFEFTVGGDQNYFLSSEPMVRYEDAQPLGDATVESVEQQ